MERKKGQAKKKGNEGSDLLPDRVPESALTPLRNLVPGIGIMKKRIYVKSLHEFEKSLSNAVRIYLKRPEGEQFKDISLQFLQVCLCVLLSFQADRKIIRIGTENMITKVILAERDYEPNRFVEFEGSIEWVYKKTECRLSTPRK